MIRCLLLIPLLAVTYSCQDSQGEHALSRNVVVIMSDDHSYRVAGCYGNGYVRTPHIDRIAAEGVLFTNAYASAPICSASRQSVLTGKYPHATGVNLLFTPFNDQRNHTMAEHLQEHGFATAIIGKTHFNDWIYYDYWDQWPDYGFDTIITAGDWRSHLQQHPPREVPPEVPTRENMSHPDNIAWQKNAQMLPVPYYDEDSQGTYLAGRAVDFIRSHAGDRFFLWVAFHEPHAPFSFPVDYAGSYDPDSLPLPQAVAEDERWVPEIFRSLTEEERRGIIASYYTSVEYMDKNVGMILDALEETELDENTLVVYTADQGYLLNEHGRFEKHTMWAESIKSPLVMKGPGIGVRETKEEVVELVDLAPTLFEMLGIPSHEALQGESLFPLISGSADKPEKAAFAEYLEDNKAMVATKKWKYVFATGKRDLGLGYATGKGPSGVVHRLYDLEADPGETTNLAYRNEHREMVDSLQGMMLDWFMETHPQAEYVPSGLDTTGKLIWFCEPRDTGDEPGSELQRIFENEEYWKKIPSG